MFRSEADAGRPEILPYSHGAPLRKRNVKKTASGSTPSLAKKNTSQGLSDPNGGPDSPPWGFEPPCPPMGAPMGGCGGPHGGLWGSTALIAPDEPWCRLGPKKDTESVSAS